MTGGLVLKSKRCAACGRVERRPQSIIKELKSTAYTYEPPGLARLDAACRVKLEFHGTDTDTDTDTDILADFHARIVARMSACPRLPRSACHEPDTHDDPRRLVRHARFSSRESSPGCPLGMRACKQVNVDCTR